MKILATRGWEDWEKAEISRAVPNVTFLDPEHDGRLEDLVNQADVFFGFPTLPLQVIVKSPTLKLIHVPSTGVDRFLTPELKGSPIVLTNSRGVHARPVAEHAVALMLALAYRILEFGRNQTAAVWRGVPIDRLEGKTAGLLGLGAIGQEIARKCKAFDMRVIGLRRNEGKIPDWVDQVFPPQGIDELLRQADFVLCSLPLTQETMHLMDYRRFSAMKPTAFFVNVGRGQVVKDEDLVRVLREGLIRGAGLDVFEVEPLPQDSPLWKMENVIVTPHAAGNAPANRKRVLDILIENLRRLERGLPLLNVVDKTLGY